MKQLLLAMIFLSGFAHAEAGLTAPAFEKAQRFTIEAAIRDTPARSTSGYAEQQRAAALTSWKRSLIPLVATQGLDVASSYGMCELNPMLAGSDGRFGAKAASIKAGTTLAVVGIEYLVVKKWPGAARMFSKLNWGSSVLTGVVAAHNYAIK